MMLLKRHALACCVLSYMGGILICHWAGWFPRPGLYDLSRLMGCSQVTLRGRVLDAPTHRWSQTRFLMEGRASPQAAYHGRVLVTLTFPDQNLAPGDDLEVRGWLYAPRPPSTGHDFDEKGYWASRRVYAMLKVWSTEGCTIRKRCGPGLRRAAWQFHQRYQDFWQSALPYEEACLLLGTTIGARGILPATLKEACIRAGVYHIVVVSGQNMSLIVSVGVSLLLAFQVPRRHALWVCFLPIVFYTAAVGADPPVVRAAVMAVVALTSSALGRDAPRFYPLLIAAGWILVAEPEALLGASFQLSFGATASILILLPFWSGVQGPRRRWRYFLRDAVWLGMAVHVGIWPLLVFYFHRLSLGGLIANWTIFPLSGVLMVMGLSIGTWGVLAPGTVPAAALAIVRQTVWVTLALIKRMSAWPYIVKHVPEPSPYAVALYYGFLFCILLMIHRRQIYEKNRPRL